MLLNGGNLVYTLDDAYIHLAMARNWLRAGTVEISPGDFAVASSSPLWTFAVTILGAVLGVRDWLPLALTIGSSVLLLCVFWWGVFEGACLGGSRSPVTRPYRWYLAAVLLPVIGHLPGLTLTGMEHPFHAAITLAFTTALFATLTQSTKANQVALYATAFLMPLIRFEGAFAIGAAVLLFALRHRFKHAVCIMVIGSLPLTLLGLYFLSRGGFFLPNSIMAKAVPTTGVVGELRNMVTLYLYQITLDSALLCLVAFAAASAWYSWVQQSYRVLALTSFLLMVTVAHLALASVGWFERYQAYLIILGLFILALVCRAGLFERFVDTRRENVVLAGSLCVLLLLGVGAKQVLALVRTPQATNNIYQQQYQMGKLIEQQFPHDAVAVNDIGLVSLRATAPVVDLVGLGSTETLRLHRAGENTFDDVVQSLLERRQVKLVAIYATHFDEKIYRSWHEVATWTVGGPSVVLGGKTVTFYTLDASRYAEVLRRLQSFESQLPPGVQVEYFPVLAGS